MRDPSARVEHEASTSKIGEDQLFYFQQRGIDTEEAVGMIISGFCSEVRTPVLHVFCPKPRVIWYRALLRCADGKVGSLGRDCTINDGLKPPAQVFQELPMEFAAEVNQLMSLKLEGSVG